MEHYITVKMMLILKLVFIFLGGTDILHLPCWAKFLWDPFQNFNLAQDLWNCYWHPKISYNKNVSTFVKPAPGMSNLILLKLKIKRNKLFFLWPVQLDNFPYLFFHIQMSNLFQQLFFYLAWRFLNKKINYSNCFKNMYSQFARLEQMEQTGHSIC